MTRMHDPLGEITWEEFLGLSTEHTVVHPGGMEEVPEWVLPDGVRGVGCCFEEIDIATVGEMARGQRVMIPYKRRVVFMVPLVGCPVLAYKGTLVGVCRACGAVYVWLGVRTEGSEDSSLGLGNRKEGNDGREGS